MSFDEVVHGSLERSPESPRFAFGAPAPKLQVRAQTTAIRGGRAMLSGAYRVRGDFAGDRVDAFHNLLSIVAFSTGTSSCDIAHLPGLGDVVLPDMPPILSEQALRELTITEYFNVDLNAMFGCTAKPGVIFAHAIMGPVVSEVVRIEVTAS